MEIYVLNKNFETVAIVDSYTSLIWTDRYYQAGDFELYLPTSINALNTFIPDYYLWNKDSEHLMVIEDLKTTSDLEEGNNLTVTGRSLESILDRRIIWSQTNITGSLHDAIKNILTNNIISPEIQERTIPNFIFEDSDDEYILGLELEAQYDGDNIYEIITKLCEDKKIGFKITLNDSNQFVFKLYRGTDRSYSQDTESFIVFSPYFENIVNSEYREVKSESKNVILVAGEGEGTSQKKASAGDLEATSLDRREIYFSGGNQSSNGQTISGDKYTAYLKEQGVEELKKHKIEKVIEGEVETSKIFIYGIDYFMGDVVEIEDEYDRHSRTRIIEFIMNQDDDGYKAYPSFEVVDEDEETDS